MATVAQLVELEAGNAKGRLYSIPEKENMKTSHVHAYQNQKSEREYQWES